MYIFVSIGIRCQLGRNSCSFLLSRIVLYVLIFFRKYYVNSDKFITLHYITLHYITLHYITLHYITLHYITLHYITLHYITLHYILSNSSSSFSRAACFSFFCRFFLRPKTSFLFHGRN